MATYDKLRGLPCTPEEFEAAIDKAIKALEVQGELVEALEQIKYWCEKLDLVRPEVAKARAALAKAGVQS